MFSSAPSRTSARIDLARRLGVALLAVGLFACTSQQQGRAPEDAGPGAAPDGAAPDAAAPSTNHLDPEVVAGDGRSAYRSLALVMCTREEACIEAMGAKQTQTVEGCVQEKLYEWLEGIAADYTVSPKALAKCLQGIQGASCAAFAKCDDHGPFPTDRCSWPAATLDDLALARIVPECVDVAGALRALRDERIGALPIGSPCTDRTGRPCSAEGYCSGPYYQPKLMVPECPTCTAWPKSGEGPTWVWFDLDLFAQCRDGMHLVGGVCVSMGEGEACSSQYGCARSLECTKEGVCGRVHEEGDVCSNAPNSCGPWLECEAGTCVYQLPGDYDFRRHRKAGRGCGEDSECASGVCQDHVCARGSRAGLGEACTTDSSCVAPHECVKGKCVQQVAPPDFESARCDEEHPCPASRQCRAFACVEPLAPRLGESCTSEQRCEVGFCEKGTCRAPRPLGAACVQDVECAARCEVAASGKGVCTIDRKPGEPCGPNVHCANGCVEGTCARLAAGMSCRGDDDCLSACLINEQGDYTCASLASESCDETVPCLQSACIRGICALAENGAACESNDGCLSGSCLENNLNEQVCAARLNENCDATTPCHLGICSSGVCAYQGLGGPCNRYSDCSSSRCESHPVSGELICLPGLGDACSDAAPCATGRCAGDVCRVLEVGSACEGFEECEHGCVPHPIQNVPVCGAGVGDSCGADPCAQGACTEGRCQWVSGGQGCSLDRHCSSDFCQAGICVRQKADVGEACGGSADCQGGACLAGTCVHVALGQPCVEGRCHEGTCVGGICRPEELGALCEEDRECASGNCLRAYCAGLDYCR